MKRHEFECVLDREPTDAEINTLYEAGFDDSGIVIGAPGTPSLIMINRKAKNRQEAVQQAISQAQQCGFQITDIRFGDKRTAGRPSFTGAGERSPQITTVLPKLVDQKITALAKAEGVKKSIIIRRAIDEYLARQSA